MSDSGDTGDTATEWHRGQLRFAERFVREHGGTFAYVHGIGWHAWDSVRWAACMDGGATRAMRATITEAIREVPSLPKSDQDDLSKDLAKMERASDIRGALSLAGDDYPCAVAGAALDGQAHLLNTLNGTVNLHTGEHRAPDPADRISKVAGGRFNPDARSEVFDDFLANIQPDPAMRSFLARSLGSALLGQVREHVLLIWHGVGANGKGTLRNAVSHALGDYSVEVPADILLQSRFGTGGAHPEKMRLRGARTAFCSEIAAGAHLDAPTMNALTGGDPIIAKLLYRDSITFNPSHTLIMLTNHLPVVRGDDPAVWRRLCAVPFKVVVANADQDPALGEKLNGAADAVLAWLWHGWLDYSRNGLAPPEAVAEATREYKLDSDVLARYLADEDAVCHGHGTVGSADLYGAFKDWCRDQGEPVDMTNKAFTEAMDLRGHRRKRGNRGAQWQDLMIVSRDGERP